MILAVVSTGAVALMLLLELVCIVLLAVICFRDWQ